MGKKKTSLEVAVGRLAAHLATKSPQTRAAAADLVRALAPMVGERKAHLEDLFDPTTRALLRSVAMALVVPFSLGRDVGALVGRAIETDGQQLIEAIPTEEKPTP